MLLVAEVAIFFACRIFTELAGAISFTLSRIPNLPQSLTFQRQITAITETFMLNVPLCFIFYHNELLLIALKIGWKIES